MTITRRKLIIGAIATLIAACTRRPDRSAAPQASAAPGQRTLAPTNACYDGDEPTIEQTEGPFFTPETPEKSDFFSEAGGGTKLVLTGTVLGTDCEPVARALLDFWQADDKGAYDNEGYRLRGHQFTDAQGRYELTTVVPGLYPGRTRHIHVKVQAPDGPVLTTQLYMPDEASNASDGIFDPTLVMDVDDSDDGKDAAFTFVVERA